MDCLLLWFQTWPEDLITTLYGTNFLLEAAPFMEVALSVIYLVQEVSVYHSRESWLQANLEMFIDPATSESCYLLFESRPKISKISQAQ